MEINEQQIACMEGGCCWLSETVYTIGMFGMGLYILCSKTNPNVTHRWYIYSPLTVDGSICLGSYRLCTSQSDSLDPPP